jgi:hypothetical protein
LSPLLVDHDLRSTVLSVVPRKQFIEAGNFVVGDTAEDVGQPNLRVDEVIDKTVCPLW